MNRFENAGWSLLLAGAAVGAGAGLLAGLCGVGGGIIMVPALTQWFGLSQKAAVATSLAVIVPTALMATWKNQQHGLIDWKLMAALAVGAVAMSFYSADWMVRMKNSDLTRLFGLVLVLIGLKMLLTKSASS
jgi:uncharacterized protein